MDEQKRNICELNRETTWRLVEVLDREGHSKVHESDLYEERIHCIATHLEYSEPNDTGFCRLYMDFIRNASGRRTNLHLNTSRVLESVIEGDTLTVTTRNSVYVFEREEVTGLEIRNEKDLIELYLNNQEEKFCGGTYYDQDGTPHELTKTLHLGMFTDTCLIGCRGVGYVCRYYLDYGPIQFYDTLTGQQDYSTRMLIHNEDDEPLEVSFPFPNASWPSSQERLNI